MTLAERWKATKPKDFASVLQYVNLVQVLDCYAVFRSEACGVTIAFSDGSTYRMEKLCEAQNHR